MANGKLDARGQSRSLVPAKRPCGTPKSPSVPTYSRRPVRRKATTWLRTYQLSLTSASSSTRCPCIGNSGFILPYQNAIERGGRRDVRRVQMAAFADLDTPTSMYRNWLECVRLHMAASWVIDRSCYWRVGRDKTRWFLPHPWRHWPSHIMQLLSSSARWVVSKIFLEPWLSVNQELLHRLLETFLKPWPPLSSALLISTLRPYGARQSGHVVVPTPVPTLCNSIASPVLTLLTWVFMHDRQDGQVTQHWMRRRYADV